jgi:hypothetical protein
METTMTARSEKLDMTALFGFEAIAGATDVAIDFTGDVFGARLGAKAGEGEAGCTDQPLDLSRLMGFEALVSYAGTGLNFDDAAAASRIGAKVGNTETDSALMSDAFASLFGAKVGEPE